jgi:hypothetical protein
MVARSFSIHARMRCCSSSYNCFASSVIFFCLPLNHNTNFAVRNARPCGGRIRPGMRRAGKDIKALWKNVESYRAAAFFLFACFVLPFLLSFKVGIGSLSQPFPAAVRRFLFSQLELKSKRPSFGD